MLTCTGQARFEAYLEKSKCNRNEGGCWLWVGSINSNGRAIAFDRRKRLYAYRLSYELHTKSAIPAGLLVCHHCDNPSCVNPEHLFLGTPLDNMRDMISKGRFVVGVKPRGEDRRDALLTAQQVREIRKRYLAGGILQRELAAEFGVHPTTVGLAIRRNYVLDVPSKAAIMGMC